MFSSKPSEMSYPKKDLYYVCVGSTNTSNVGKSLMADQGKVLYGGYVSEK